MPEQCCFSVVLRFGQEDPDLAESLRVAGWRINTVRRKKVLTGHWNGDPPIDWESKSFEECIGQLEADFRACRTVLLNRQARQACELDFAIGSLRPDSEFFMTNHRIPASFLALLAEINCVLNFSLYQASRKRESDE